MSDMFGSFLQRRPRRDADDRRSFPCVDRDFPDFNIRTGRRNLPNLVFRKEDCEVFLFPGQWQMAKHAEFFRYRSSRLCNFPDLAFRRSSRRSRDIRRPRSFMDRRLPMDVALFAFCTSKVSVFGGKRPVFGWSVRNLERDVTAQKVLSYDSTEAWRPFGGFVGDGILALTG